MNPNTLVLGLAALNKLADLIVSLSQQAGKPISKEDAIRTMFAIATEGAQLDSVFQDELQKFLDRH